MRRCGAATTPERCSHCSRWWPTCAVPGRPTRTKPMPTTTWDTPCSSSAAAGRRSRRSSAPGSWKRAHPFRALWRGRGPAPEPDRRPPTTSDLLGTVRPAGRFARRPLREPRLCDRPEEDANGPGPPGGRSAGGRRRDAAAAPARSAAAAGRAAASGAAAADRRRGTLEARHLMTDMAPSSDDPNQGLNYDLGVSLHEWTTRWSQIEEDRDEEPGEALRDATQLLREMANQQHVPTDPVSAPETEEFTRALEALNDLVSRYEHEEPVDDDEFDDAFVNAREMFDLLVGDRDDAEAGP